jgi:acetyl esterase/lipase
MRQIIRAATRRLTPPYLLVAAALMASSCSDDDVPTGPISPISGGTVENGAISYDGSHHAALGPFPITDLRSRIVGADGDSVDLYAAMESYETRNLTVFQPAGASGCPVVVVVHGGGWTDGYMEWYAFTAGAFTGEFGYVTVVINYRLTSDQVFPASICPTRDSEAPDPALKAAWYPDNLHDCADALQWVVDHIAGYGGDPERIFLIGHSAGAHLVSLLATHDDYAAMRPHIRGVISMSGGYDLSDLSQLTFGHALELTFGTSTDTAILGEASPASYLAAGATMPPFLVLYCELDLPSLERQAVAFSARLDELGHAVELVYLPGYDHVSEMQALEDADALPTDQMRQFIDTHP